MGIPKFPGRTSLRRAGTETHSIVLSLGKWNPRGITPMIRRVLSPLLKKSLAGAWILVFITATRELSAAIFLVGPNTRVISVMLFDLSEEGNFEVLSALGAILLVITVAIAAIGFKVIGRDFMLRRT